LPTAREVLRGLADKQALAPPNKTEIRDDTDVLIRIFYDKENDWSKALYKQLLASHQTVTAILGAKLTEMPVFIFDDWARCEGFLKKALPNRSGFRPGFGTSGHGIVAYCRPSTPEELQQADSVKIGAPPGEYLRIAVSSDITKALIDRIVGYSRIPFWLTFG